MLPLVLAAVVVGAPAGDDEGWLLTWLEGAPARRGAMYARFPGSPHVGGSLRHEAAQRARDLLGAGEARARLAERALAVLEERAVRPDRRQRAVDLLVWLRAPAVVERLVRLSSGGRPAVRAAAASALRGYSTAVHSEVSIVFGGSVRTTEFPAAGDGRATAALVRATGDGDRSVRRAAIQSLAAHLSPDADSALLDALARKRELDLIIPLVVKRRLEVTAAQLRPALRSTDPLVREAAATAYGALGLHASRGDLLPLLDDGKAAVFAAAHGSLRTLSGMFGPTAEDSADDRPLLRALWRERLGRPAR